MRGCNGRNCYRPSGPLCIENLLSQPLKISFLKQDVNKHPIHNSMWLKTPAQIKTRGFPCFFHAVMHFICTGNSILQYCCIKCLQNSMFTALSIKAVSNNPQKPITLPTTSSLSPHFSQHTRPSFLPINPESPKSKSPSNNNEHQKQNKTENIK